MISLTTNLLRLERRRSIQVSDMALSHHSSSYEMQYSLPNMRYPFWRSCYCTYTGQLDWSIQQQRSTLINSFSLKREFHTTSLLQKERKDWEKMESHDAVTNADRMKVIQDQLEDSKKVTSVPKEKESSTISNEQIRSPGLNQRGLQNMNSSSSKQQKGFSLFDRLDSYFKHLASKSRSRSRGEDELTEYASKSILLPHISTLTAASFSNNIKLSIIQAWHSIMMNILPLGSASLDNRVEVYTNGDNAFENMWRSIDEAKEEINYETYILKPDLVGLKTMSHLAAAARRGVKVTFIYDYVGSSLYIGNSHLQEMVDSGVNVIAFNPVLPRIFSRLRGSNSLPLLNRNHRKILIVDGKVGYCGGLNTSSDYAGPKYGICRFRDTHMKIEGPAVNDLKEVFLDSYSEATIHSQRSESGKTIKKMVKENELIQSVASNLNKDKIIQLIRTNNVIKGNKDDVKEIIESIKSEISQNWKLRVGRYKSKIAEISQPDNVEDLMDKENQGVFAQVLSSNVLRNKIHLQNAVIEIIRRSGKEVLITNPFLLPPKRISNALISAANRGVSVKIITSGKSDTPFMRWASTHVYHEYLKHSKIEIYEYQPQILHAKTVTVDNLFCSIGSFNFDLLSGFRNLEVNVTFLDQKSASILQKQFEIDMASCKQVTLQSLEERTFPEKTLHWFCYSLSRIISLIL